jgi:thiamine biosynthesis lipoprotein
VYLRDEAISTSGTSEKFFEAEGHTYSHIMDPRTGYPAQGMLEVAIVAPKTIDSEAWTKPYFVLGRGWAAQHKPNDWKLLMCEDKVDRPCSWVR